VIKSGATYAAALTDVKRKLVANPKWQHPFYWAPFILMGS
jgi:CHAT domain-containing protein